MRGRGVVPAFDDSGHEGTTAPEGADIGYPCKDCGVNTIPREGNREYYEVKDEIWAAANAPGIGQSDNGTSGYFLCIGCLEYRLGYRLVKDDFKNVRPILLVRG